jgi:hypothetical protein
MILAIQDRCREVWPTPSALTEGLLQASMRPSCEVRLLHDLQSSHTDGRDSVPAGRPVLRSFVSGLRSDPDAVTADLTLPRSSGAVDGYPNSPSLPVHGSG